MKQLFLLVLLLLLPGIFAVDFQGTKTSNMSTETTKSGSSFVHYPSAPVPSPPAVEIKRTNPGVVGNKSAEIIFDVVNVDMVNNLEGFFRCTSPDDAEVSAATGIDSSAAQYVSPIFTLDNGPSQKSITLTFESVIAGEKKIECVLKYCFFKYQKILSGTIKNYVRSDGIIVREKSDSIFNESKHVKSVCFFLPGEEPTECPPVKPQPPENETSIGPSPVIPFDEILNMIKLFIAEFIDIVGNVISVILQCISVLFDHAADFFMYLSDVFRGSK